MDISKIKIIRLGKGRTQIELDDEAVERFKLFCLTNYYIGKSIESWKLKKIQSSPSGMVILHVQGIGLTPVNKLL